MLVTLLLTFGAFIGLSRFSLAAYSLSDDYSGANFLNGFTFFTDDDPTEGYVDYVDGQASGLFSQSGGSVKLSVDSSNVASGRGRQSLRLTSKASYNHALIILDIGHMPDSICGVWPAFWSTGPDWPSNGEIDVLEGVNTQTTNKMTLHSDPGCSINGKDCQGSQGCSIDAGPYGSKINSAGGATFALEWTSDGMSIWSWSGSAPSDASSDSPDPSGWGSPAGSFPSGSGCDIDSFFKNQQIVFDTTFCGVWAGDSWPDDPTCSALAPTCQEYVQNNPSAFKDAYWTINSLKVFTNSDGSSSSGSSTGGTGSTGTSPKPSAPVQSSGGEASQPPVAPPPAPAPASTPAPSPAPVPTAWGPGGGGNRGGRGGRGGPPRIRRRERGRHSQKSIVELSGGINEQTEAVLFRGDGRRES